MHIEMMNFTSVIARLRRRMVEQGQSVHTERWQGIDISKNPAAEMFELRHVHLEVPLLTEDLAHWRDDIKPNLPWADDHFEERVCGAPINPGATWEYWVRGASADKFRKGGTFNHNYMERYWPKHAGKLDRSRDGIGATRTAQDFASAFATHTAVWPSLTAPHRGIRHTYGDLGDVVDLLAREPLTRQAYLPIFFPEDTGVGDGDRKPCSLGYHFMMRDGLLDVFYPMRSVDLVHHFQDDLYLTVRLVIWVLERLRERDAATWSQVKPGRFVMQMSSLHCFVNDMIQLRKEHAS